MRRRVFWGTDHNSLFSRVCFYTLGCYTKVTILLKSDAPYICMKHLTLIKVRTAVPTWLLYNISVYKNRLWKIKNWDQFLEILVSPCLSLSQILAESPSGARNLPCLLIIPGLLRSDRGGLSVSSPSGERKDACGLRKWCRLLVFKFYWSPA